MREVALQLCAERPSTTEAVRLIRNRRRGGGDHPTLPLTDAVLKAVHDFRRAHPDASEEMIAAALDEALVVILAEQE